MEGSDSEKQNVSRIHDKSSGVPLAARSVWSFSRMMVSKPVYGQKTAGELLDYFRIADKPSGIGAYPPQPLHAIIARTDGAHSWHNPRAV
jgi:hypothetical protein